MARRLGRRVFLTGIGGIALALPILESLLPRAARAGGVTPPKRFFSIVSHSGQLPKEWYPTHTPPGYQLTDSVFSSFGKCPDRPCKQDGTTYLHEQLPEDSRYRYAPLSDFSTDTGISTVLHQSLNPFLEKMTLLRGVDIMSTIGHNGGGAFLGNYNTSKSDSVKAACPATTTIDEVMAYSTQVYAKEPVMRALHIATGFPGSASATNYGIAGGAVETLDGYNDPLVIWQQLFKDIAPASTGAPPPEDPNLSLLNAVYDDYHRLKLNPRLGAQDRELLERHVGFLAEIEASIKAFQAIDCSQPETPPSIKTTTKLTDPDQLRAAVKLLIDLAVAAVVCDVTRIVTFNISLAAHDGTGTWQTSLHNAADVPSDWHHYAHDALSTQSSMTNLRALNRWIADELFAHLLTRLDVTEGADGSTILDHSLAVWGNELGFAHYNMSMPTLVAGSAGGAVRTNRYIDYSKWDGTYANPIPQGVLIPGVPHNRFLVTCLQAMGLTPLDYEQPDVPGYGSQAVVSAPNGLSADSWDFTEIGKPLPGVLTAS